MDFLNKISKSLLLSKSSIIKFAASAPYRYKVYQIPKKNSFETRTIAHPSKELKFIQRLIIEELEEILPIENCVFSYRKGRGIKENAMKHIDSRYLLKMDFKSFFPSIKPFTLFQAMSKIGIEINEQDKKLLTGLLFWKPLRKGPLILSIGAPSSPLISNFIMNEFDKIIYTECKRKKIAYTRYSDDLTFSTNIKNILFEIPELVDKCLKQTTEGQIKINKSKTVFSSKAHNRHVTGVTLSNYNELSIGRNKKRLLTSMIHKFSLDLLSKDEIYYLKGFLSHVVNIEPSFFIRMEKKYGSKIMDDLLKYNL